MYIDICRGLCSGDGGGNLASQPQRPRPRDQKKIICRGEVFSHVLLSCPRESVSGDADPEIRKKESAGDDVFHTCCSSCPRETVSGDADPEIRKKESAGDDVFHTCCSSCLKDKRSLSPGPLSRVPRSCHLFQVCSASSIQMKLF